MVSLAEARGYHVTGTCRNIAKKYSAISEWLELDISSLSSVENFLTEVKGKEFELILFLAGATNPQRINLAGYISTYFSNTIFLMERLIEEFGLNSPCCFIFVSSRAVKYPSFDVYYSAIKAGLVSALRSLSLFAHPESKLISVMPGLIEKSQMYLEMEEYIRKSHHLRSNNGLLSILGTASAIFEVIENKDNFDNGALVEIGPSYT